MNKETKQKLREELSQKSKTDVIDFVFQNLEKVSDGNFELVSDKLILFLLTKAHSSDDNFQKLLDSINSLQQQVQNGFKDLKDQLSDIDRDLNNVFGLTKSILDGQDRFVKKEEIGDLTMESLKDSLESARSQS